MQLMQALQLSQLEHSSSCKAAHCAVVQKASCDWRVHSVNECSLLMDLPGSIQLLKQPLPLLLIACSALLPSLHLVAGWSVHAEANMAKHAQC
jgi:hypothetical protein